MDRLRAILFISILLSTFHLQAQEQLKPTESEVDIEVNPPIQKVVRIDGGYYGRGEFCGLTERQKDVLWKKILVSLTDEYPKHSKYCEREHSPTTKSFIAINGICHAYVRCKKTVDGVEILQGYFIVEVDEKALEVTSFIDVAW